MSALVDLLRESKRLGFLGPGAVDDHILHAQAYLAALVGEQPDRYLDLGSGGGVPGLVLVEAWSTSRCTLVDAQLRRARFLEEAVAALGAEARVEVVHARAEELARDLRHRASYDLVTARSFGAPAITAECARGFLLDGGRLVVSEPPTADAARWPAAGLAALDLHDGGVVQGGTSSVRVLRAVGEPPPGVPRRAPAMARTPRF